MSKSHYNDVQLSLKVL